MGKDAKKAAVSDEWRNKDVEERLSYSLIKVILYRDSFAYFLGYIIYLT
jgi:hypothetical protein